MVDKNKKILNNLIVYNPINKKIRLGRNDDGGYVIVDCDNYDAFISFGVGFDVSFDVDFFRHKKNIPYFAFDGTMDKPPTLPEQFFYLRKNIDFDNTEKILINQYENIFLKMDIEGDEWNWIRGVSDSLYKIKQLVFEAHAMFVDKPPKMWSKGLSNDEYSNNILASLEILNKTHNLVHIHENNNVICPFVKIGEHKYPSTAELTFLRKDISIDGKNINKLPIDNIDFPCYPTKHRTNEKYDMNIPPFVFTNKNSDFI